MRTPGPQSGEIGCQFPRQFPGQAILHIEHQYALRCNDGIAAFCGTDDSAAEARREPIGQSQSYGSPFSEDMAGIVGQADDDAIRGRPNIIGIKRLTTGSPDFIEYGHSEPCQFFPQIHKLNDQLLDWRFCFPLVCSGVKFHHTLFSHTVSRDNVPHIEVPIVNQ